MNITDLAKGTAIGMFIFAAGQILAFIFTISLFLIFYAFGIELIGDRVLQLHFQIAGLISGVGIGFILGKKSNSDAPKP